MEKNSESVEIKNRIAYAGGDMLQAIPKCNSDRDVYLFMGIFHGFGEQDSMTILHNLKQAIGSFNPCIVIADAVAAEKDIGPITASLDMQMLMGTKGRERTGREWESLFRQTWFKLDTIIDIRTFAKYIVISKG